MAEIKHDHLPPPDALLDAINELFKDALSFDHEFIHELSWSREAGKISELRRILGLHSDYSRFRNGSLKIDREGARPRYPAVAYVERILSYLKDEREIIDSKDDEDRSQYRKFARAIRQHWLRDEAPTKLHDVVDLLEDHLRYLKRKIALFADDEDQKTRHRIVKEVEAIRQRRDFNQTFIVDPSPDTLPSVMRAQEAFHYRDDELAKLTAIHSKWSAGGVLVCITAPPWAGKSEFIRQFITKLADGASKSSHAFLTLISPGEFVRYEQRLLRLKCGQAPPLSMSLRMQKLKKTKRISPQADCH